MTPTCLTISDFNVSNFNALLVNDQCLPTLKTVEAPFGQVQQLLADASAQCWESPPSCVIVWTQPQAVIESFAKAIAHEPVELDNLLAEVDQYVTLLKAASRRTPLLLVPAWVLPTYERGLGLLDLRRGLGLDDLLARMNLQLAEQLHEKPGVFMLSTHRWVEQAGPRAFNPKLWYMSKTVFGKEVFKAAASDVKGALRAISGKSRKLVIVDLDETLWGGLVGEVGWESLTLGGHDPEGEALVDFQRALKGLANRGILLAIVSKNTESVALEAIDKHPEMLLNRGDFAGWKINWRDKAENVLNLVTELNLGLQSAVFIDDNPVERARVSEALPEVLVPDWPADKTNYRKALLELACFDTATLTNEDRQRTQMYVDARHRKASRTRVASLDEWIRSLNVVVEIERLNRGNLARSTQLLNKTNQMNLSTRRMTETEFLGWATTPSHIVWTFRVTDRFGSLGLTGLASLSLLEDHSQLEDFVLSCRILGRRVEETILATVIEHAMGHSALPLRSQYIPTEKNGPCLDFFKRSGLRQHPDGIFTWDQDKAYPYPKDVCVQQDE